jgi:hypothetical protein
MQRRETKMIRSLKILGLLAVAALSMSAMFASAAQAQHQLGVYTAGLTPETLTASTIHGAQEGLGSENFFESFGSKVECENSGITFTSTVAAKGSTVLTVTPHYKDCKQGGTQDTVVTMNECDYTFTQPTRTAPTANWTAKVDLFCPVGKKIEVHVYSSNTSKGTGPLGFVICTLKIYPKVGTEQELGGGVTYTPGVNGGKDDITVDVDVTGITTTKEGLCGHAHTETGIYKSKVTVTGKDEVNSNPHDVWIAPAVAGKTP